MAVLPANLLISDTASDWLKLGIPVALQHDLMTAHSLIAGFAPDEATAIRGGATRLLRTSVESRQSALHLEATMFDAASHKVIRVDNADVAAVSALLPAIDALAKKIDRAAIDFSTRNQQAWQSLATGYGLNNPQQRAQFMNQAINQDQNFGTAWIGLMDMISPAEQTDLKKMIDDGTSHRNGFSPYDRAKFDMALNRLLGAAPADQIKTAKEILALAPNDLDVMATMGNYQILQGDSAVGEQSLRRAASLNSANVGLRFELARGLMRLRKFKDAETIFNSIGNTPAVYPELATCILLEGDTTRATETAARFVASVQNAEIKPMLRAAWEVMSGNRQHGIDLMLSSKFNNPNLNAMALSEAAIWQIMGGDFAGGQRTLAQLTRTSGALTLPEVAGLLADNVSAVADWQKKVQALALTDTVKEPILAYGFFLRGNYSDAAKVWRHIADTSHGSDLRARAMLASSFDHLGKTADAKRISVMPFTPEFADLYSAISFTEMRRMLRK